MILATIPAEPFFVGSANFWFGFAAGVALVVVGNLFGIALPAILRRPK